MNFDCKCTSRQKAVGDGCLICNTEYAISVAPQPEELAEELVEGGLTDLQAETIANEVFQPLMSLISTLSDKVDQLSKKIQD